jgi:hypothetical protein
VEEHCRWLRPILQTYRDKYLARLTPFFAAHRPVTLPVAVVYPFGGGDLLSALATYPGALEYTTLSLEHAGDPRRIRELDQPRLARSLAQLRQRIKGLFAYAESTSENLMQMQRGDIPGQLAFSLVALSAHGYEPVGLRYFHVQPDGSLHYLAKEEIATEERRLAPRLTKVWVSPDFTAAFSDSELTFRRLGEGAEAPLRVHRHMAANLSDDHLAQDPGLVKHLEAKGKVAAMTKAASYLLWAAGFAQIRSYLLSNMVFMVSDSTGVPPHYATKAGFLVETYGRFKGPFLLAPRATTDEFVKLWSGQPYRPLPFRYGYPDASGQNHMMIVRPAASASPTPAAAATAATSPAPPARTVPAPEAKPQR